MIWILHIESAKQWFQSVRRLLALHLKLFTIDSELKLDMRLWSSNDIRFLRRNHGRLTVIGQKTLRLHQKLLPKMDEQWSNIQYVSWCHSNQPTKWFRVKLDMKSWPSNSKIPIHRFCHLMLGTTTRCCQSTKRNEFHYTITHEHRTQHQHTRMVTQGLLLLPITYG